MNAKTWLLLFQPITKYPIRYKRVKEYDQVYKQNINTMCSVANLTYTKQTVETLWQIRLVTDAADSPDYSFIKSSVVRFQCVSPFPPNSALYSQICAHVHTSLCLSVPSASSVWVWEYVCESWMQEEKNITLHDARGSSFDGVWTGIHRGQTVVFTR